MRLIVSVLAIQVLLPLVFIGWLAAGVHRSRLNWLLHTLVSGSVVAFAVVVGNWGWTSVYLQVSLPLLWAAAAAFSWRRTRSRWRAFHWGETATRKLSTVAEIFVGAVFIPVTLFATSGYFPETRPVELQFPLKDGVYHVGQGGDLPLINYHNVHQAQRYALDIGKLNVFGTRAAGLYPEQPVDYAVYGETLYSPCAGVVREAVFGLRDHWPPERDPEHPAGNYLVIECNGVDVVIAHMMKASAAVASGEAVMAGQAIGRVGNSGNTSEPHLHIHAEREGRGVPILFDGRFLVRNSLVWK